MKFIGLLLIFWSFANLLEATIRFTNVKCDEYHREYASIPLCRLKLVRRGVVSLNIHVKLWQEPTTNVSINLSLHKKASGYRPFLYNMTVDFCKFMANRNQYPFAKLFFDAVLKDSNINHTCPYDHDIIVKNLIINENTFKYLPLPNGEYMFQLKVAAYNDWKANVEVYMELNTKFGL